MNTLEATHPFIRRFSVSVAAIVAAPPLVIADLLLLDDGAAAASDGRDGS